MAILALWGWIAGVRGLGVILAAQELGEQHGRVSVPAQTQRGQDDNHEHQEEEALVHGNLIFT